MTFVGALVAGDVPKLEVGNETTLFAAGASSSVVTLVEGNGLSGSWAAIFTFPDGQAAPDKITTALAHDATAEEVAMALINLEGVSDVEVTRSGPDGADGYVWFVTFRGSPTGDIPLLEVDVSLLGVDQVAQYSTQYVDVSTLTNGSALRGTFTLGEHN